MAFDGWRDHQREARLPLRPADPVVSGHHRPTAACALPPAVESGLRVEDGGRLPALTLRIAK
jgi:hypothetical protein